MWRNLSRSGLPMCLVFLSSQQGRNGMPWHHLLALTRTYETSPRQRRKNRKIGERERASLVLHLSLKTRRETPLCSGVGWGRPAAESDLTGGEKWEVRCNFHICFLFVMTVQFRESSQQSQSIIIIRFTSGVATCRLTAEQSQAENLQISLWFGF